MPDQLPQHCPSPRELDDLELLLSGALAPRTSYDDQVTLSLPAEPATAVEAGGQVELVDPEGLPLARYGRDGLEPLAAPSHGPFRRLHRSPAEVRVGFTGAPVVLVTRALTTYDLTRINAARQGAPVVLLVLCGTGTPQGLSPVGLLRATVAAAHLLGRHAHVVACPLPGHDDPQLDERLRDSVARQYTDGQVLEPRGDGNLPAEIARIVDSDQPPEDERGLVVFFTGLSGSGKSTLAQALHDLLLEDGRRTVTSLDGDVVRRNLSTGLTFSREDRETNIRRIGWVAAEIARHRGIAICSPIAPFDSTRRQVRRMAEDAGGRFVLVHVATPLQECERRDRKGLYAKARAGAIPEFTGISSPYDEPTDADLRVDTTGRTVSDVLAEVVAVLPFDPVPPATPAEPFDPEDPA